MTPYMRRLKNELDRVNTKILNYQHKCKHSNVIKKHCANTGHLCSADDLYWIEYKCPDCLKSWSEKY